GFRLAGRQRRRLRSSVGWYDSYVFGLLRGDPVGSLEASPAAPDFSRGLLTAVVRDEADGAVLMVAHMDEEAYRRTRESGRAWFWSRSRADLWEKGATSGNHMDVVSITLDCDGDAVLLSVRPAGPACHTGARSC